MKKVAIIISPNYKDYAEKYLAECVAGLVKQDYRGEMKIFIADNESTEESYEYLKKIFKELDCGSEPAMTNAYEILRNKTNDGFAKGNNDCLELAIRQGYDYLALFNMDTVAETDCIRKMVDAVEFSGAGAVQARIMLYSKEDLTQLSPSQGEGLINSLGNVTHFLGFGYARGYREKMTNDKFPMAEEIAYPSGAAVMFTKEALEKVGLFDEEFWMYNEDQDLGWRLWLNGFRCVLASQAVVYHKYEFSRSLKKYYFMDRNRIMSIIKNYRLATLILILPAFVVMEIGLIFFSARGGWFKEKLKVYAYFLSAKNWRRMIEERKKIQSSRILTDREIVRLFSGKIWYQEINGWALKMANMIFNAYWKIIRVLIWW